MLKIIKEHNESDFASANIRTRCVCAVQVFHFFVVCVKTFALHHCLRFLSRLDPSLLFAVVRLILSAMVIVRILFALILPSFVRISSILTYLLHSFQLLLLFFVLLLLSFVLSLLLFFSFLVLFSSLVLDRAAHIHVLTVLSESFAIFWSRIRFFLCHLFIECLSVFFDWKLSILIDWNLNDSLELYFLSFIMKILQICMIQSLFDCDSIFRIEN